MTLVGSCTGRIILSCDELMFGCCVKTYFVVFVVVILVIVCCSFIMSRSY